MVRGMDMDDPEHGVMNEERRRLLERFWPYLRNVTIVMLVLWFFFAFVVHTFPLIFPGWTKVTILGAPLHWWMATEISILAYIALIFAYAYLVSKKEEEILREVEES